MTPDVLWLSDFAQASILRIVKPKRIVLHIIDDYINLPAAPRSLVAVERELVSRADLVVVSHPGMTAKYEKMGARTQYVPQGVVVEDFITTTAPPPEYAEIPRPRAIYMGALAEWIDWDLLIETIKLCEDISFVFIGNVRPTSDQVQRSFETLVSMSNVHWLGFHSDVLPYLQHSDTGIIPFGDDDFVQLMNPKKLYEYVAAGLPVVSKHPIWDRIGLTAEIPMVDAPSAQEFAEAVTRLSEQTGVARSQSLKSGVEFAQAHSWAVRFRDVMDLLDDQALRN
jgi:glycosyltransferase involved in cell wall biosynthesis